MDQSREVAKNSKVSVIIPCFNQGKFLLEAIESVRAQTFTNWELIVVDDGSTDPETKDILRKIPELFPDARIIQQENKGAAAARNTGIREARGEFFLPLDADDTIEPAMLEKCHAEISKNPELGFVYTHTRFFGSDNSVWKNPEYNFYEMLSANHATVSALVRKCAWQEVGGYDGDKRNRYEDWEFWINLSRHGWFGSVIKEPLFNYRKHGDSRVSDSELKYDENVKYIREKHKDLYAKESLRKIRKTWKPLGGGSMLRFAGTKLKGAGLGDAELWKKHPLKVLGRLIPVRIKRRVNIIFQKKIFDTSYYKRSDN